VGSPALKGCPDTDRDGVPDVEDRCPQAAGSKDLQGCPDLGRDRVADIDDRCPNQPGTPANLGCPEPTAEDLAFLERIQQEVSYEAGKATLIPASLSLMDSLADIMARMPHYAIRIEGHTDSLGTEAEKLALTLDRAQACRNRLIQQGIAASRIFPKGKGDKEPIAPNDTPEGRSLNRRTLFVLFLD
jgi:OOP family OmpA-OmpF porin